MSSCNEHEGNNLDYVQVNIQIRFHSAVGRDEYVEQKITTLRSQITPDVLSIIPGWIHGHICLQAFATLPLQ
jgi:hypothetical protein